MKRLALVLAVLLTACTGTVSVEAIDDSVIRCQSLGGLAWVAVDAGSRDYWYIKAGCKNGSVVNTTIKRRE